MAANAPQAEELPPDPQSSKNFQDFPRRVPNSQASENNLQPAPTTTHRSFADRKARRSQTIPLRILEVGEMNMMRDIGRGLPGDVTRKQRSQSKPELLKQRSQYFEDAFAAKDANPAQERAIEESIIVAELTTNIEIANKEQFITDFTYQVSNRYFRPITSVVVLVRRCTGIMFCATYQPSYVLEIHALPAQLQPTTNKRNAALMQQWLAERLEIGPARGLIRFVPNLEANVAFKGKTLAGMIEEPPQLTDREKAEEFSGLRRARSKGRSRLSSFAGFRSAPIDEHAASSSRDPVTRASTPFFGSDHDQQPVRQAKRAKSFFGNLLSRK